MIVNYSDQKVIKGEKSIFLAGPTPRNQNSISYRIEAIEILKKLNFDGVVFVPECSVMKPKDDYVAQADWEREAMTEANAILFWLNRKLPDNLGLTTNFEFGDWIHTNKIVYGRPNDADKIKYPDWRYNIHCNIPPIDNLETALKEAMLLADKLHILRKYEKSLKNVIEEIYGKTTKFYESITDALDPIECQYIKDCLIGKCCDNCTNGSCNVETREKIGVDEQGRPVGENCIGWSNPDLIGRSKVLKSKNIYDLR